jgi:hypothetical protein
MSVRSCARSPPVVKALRAARLRGAGAPVNAYDSRDSPGDATSLYFVSGFEGHGGAGRGRSNPAISTHSQCAAFRGSGCSAKFTPRHQNCILSVRCLRCLTRATSVNDSHDHDEKPWSCPACLYHYTSVDALLGMMKDRGRHQELRATHYAYLNDYSEIRHGLNVIREYASRWVGSITFGAQDDAFQQIGNDALKWLCDGFPLGHQLFVSCFSEHGNLLSQWRAYTRPNKGLSLRFDRERLQAFMARHGFDICRCEYLPEHQRKDYTFMSRMVSAAKKADASATPDPQHYYEVFNTFTNEILRTAVGIKHAAFEEEREWRFVSQNLSSEEMDQRVQFREGASSVVPYLSLCTGEGEQLPLNGIAVGPTPFVQQSMEALRTFLSAAGRPDIPVSDSGVPFRSQS